MNEFEKTKTPRTLSEAFKSPEYYSALEKFAPEKKPHPMLDFFIVFMGGVLVGVIIGALVW